MTRKKESSAQTIDLQLGGGHAQYERVRGHAALARDRDKVRAKQQAVVQELQRPAWPQFMLFTQAGCGRLLTDLGGGVHGVFCRFSHEEVVGDLGHEQNQTFHTIVNATLL